jgi:hypothetical protein
MKSLNKILFISILLSVYSCKSIEYVPVETVRTEYKYVYSTDTIINNNTTYIKEKGDTIFIYNTKEVYKYRDRIDTCIVNDTITKYVDKIKYVEVNKLKKWQIILMVLGGLLLGIIGYKLIRIIKI